MDKLEEARNLLESAIWASSLSSEVLDSILEHATFRSDARKSYVFRLGDPSSSFYGVLSGQVRLSIPAKTGDEFILVDVNPGMWFGQTTLIDASPRAADAIALVDSEIVEIPTTIVRGVAEEYPEIYKSLLDDQSFFVRMLCNLMASMLFYPLKARVATRLLSVIGLYGRQEGPSAYLETTLSQGDFAKLASGSRQQVNRIFRQWDEEGIVMFTDGQYHVPSVQRLVDESESTES